MGRWAQAKRRNSGPGLQVGAVAWVDWISADGAVLVHIQHNGVPDYFELELEGESGGPWVPMESGSIAGTADEWQTGSEVTTQSSLRARVRCRSGEAVGPWADWVIL